MISIRVSHTGQGVIAEKIKRFNQIRNSRQDVRFFEDALDRASERVYKDARVRTGFMRSTIEVRPAKNHVNISVGAYYSVFIERGTEHHRAFPFFFQNVYASVQTALNEVKSLYMK